MQQVTPFLWFNEEAEEAANFYVSVFDDAKITDVERFPEEGTPGEPGAALAVNFTVKGDELVALNGGPEFTFTPAVLLLVHCQSQDEVDRYWDPLSESGETMPCGWVTPPLRRDVADHSRPPERAPEGPRFPARECRDVSHAEDGEDRDRRAGSRRGRR
jgi:predicted 3-demethylubiquinone-9 3-methyltransferase (glyoxalase superfamily)